MFKGKLQLRLPFVGWAMNYTKEDVRALAAQVEIIHEAMKNIDEMDLHILNHVGIDEYPFEASFDELTLKVGAWLESINGGIK